MVRLALARPAWMRGAVVGSVFGAVAVLAAPAVAATWGEPAEAYVHQGVMLARQGDWPAALADFDAALATDPALAAAHVDRGFALLRLGHPRAALDEADAALRLTPGDALAHNIRGRAEEQLGATAAARAEYREALMLAPGNAAIARNLHRLSLSVPTPPGDVAVPEPSWHAPAPPDVPAPWTAPPAPVFRSPWTAPPPPPLQASPRPSSPDTLPTRLLPQSQPAPEPPASPPRLAAPALPVPPPYAAPPPRREPPPQNLALNNPALSNRALNPPTLRNRAAEVPAGPAIPPAAEPALLDRPQNLPPAPGIALRAGSGVVLDDGTWIVTNHHVIAGASSVAVRNGGGYVRRASIVAISPTDDLALLRLDRPFPATPGVPLAALTPPVAGRQVLVMGYPVVDVFGSRRPNLTTGLVARTDGLRDDPATFQLTAAIRPGNSGSPVFDLQGHLLGIVSELLLQQGHIPAMADEGGAAMSIAIKASRVLALMRPQMHGAAMTVSQDVEAPMLPETLYRKELTAVVLVVAYP